MAEQYSLFPRASCLQVVSAVEEEEIRVERARNESLEQGLAGARVIEEQQQAAEATFQEEKRRHFARVAEHEDRVGKEKGEVEKSERDRCEREEERIRLGRGKHQVMELEEKIAREAASRTNEQ